MKITKLFAVLLAVSSPLLLGDTKVAQSQVSGLGSVFLLASANGISTSNSAAANKAALQALIDANATAGATIYFTDPVPMAGGIDLKSNVKLLGNKVAGKGSLPQGGGSPSLSATPSGGAFIITDTTNRFITLKSNTAVEGLIFFYPNQAFNTTTPGSSIITYPATITKGTGQVTSVSICRNAFVGGSYTMDFYTNSDVDNWCADLSIEQNYDYPSSGVFFKSQFCLDIPRINRNHINPGVGDTFLGHIPFSNDFIYYVTGNGSPTFDLYRCDEFMMAQNFCYGVRTAFRINDSYGVLVNCNADQSEVGCYVTLTNAVGYRYVSLVSFSYISGAGTEASRNAVVFDGDGGKLFLTDLHGITTTPANSLLKISGTGAQRISINGARTRKAGSSDFAKFIDQTNSSALLSYSDVDQQDVTTPQVGWQMNGVTVGTVTSETATRYVPITIGGVNYKLLASP